MKAAGARFQHRSAPSCLPDHFPLQDSLQGELRNENFQSESQNIGENFHGDWERRADVSVAEPAKGQSLSSDSQRLTTCDCDRDNVRGRRVGAALTSLAPAPLSAAPSRPSGNTDLEASRKRKLESKDDVTSLSMLTGIQEIFDKGTYPFQIAVMSAKCFGSLSHNALIHVEEYILNRIRIEIKKKGKVLRFEDVGSSKNGWLIITCADQETVDWLLKLNIPDYDSIEFSPISVRALPSAFTADLVLPPVSINQRAILEMLQHQNSGLKTRTWIVLNRKQKVNNTVLRCRIPADQIPLLRRVKFRPYFEFSRASIRNCSLPIKNRHKSSDCINKNTKRRISCKRRFDSRHLSGNKSTRGACMIDSSSESDESTEAEAVKVKGLHATSRVELKLNQHASSDDVISLSDDCLELPSFEGGRLSGGEVRRGGEEAGSEPRPTVCHLISSDSDDEECSEICNAFQKSIWNMKHNKFPTECLVLSDSDEAESIEIKREKPVPADEVMDRSRVPA